VTGSGVILEVHDTLQSGGPLHTAGEDKIWARSKLSSSNSIDRHPKQNTEKSGH
jgi:hypothetical protein